MIPKKRLAGLAVAALGALALPCQVRAADDDVDALSLPSAPEAAAPRPASPSTLRVFVEATAGRIEQRYDLPDQNLRRLSLDLNWSTALSERWRFAMSDRLDDRHPADAPDRSTVNSLREAFVGWQDASGVRLADFGRVNLRNGPAYGYNPTDYLRAGAQRTVTSVDPLAQRENRQGTVMLRGQQLWSGGSASLALAPKLADAPSRESFSLDLGSTNGANKLLASWSWSASDKLGGQWLAYGEQDRGGQLGVSLTALLSDSVVGFVEGSRGRDDDLFSAIVGGVPKQATRNRVALGATWTTPTRLALTAEYEYNGFAPDRATWDAGAAAGPVAYGQYLLEMQKRQDIASRQAWLVYASQKNLIWKSLELTGLLRINAEDHSRLGWIELRHHWEKADLALQWLSTSGSALSEYGLPSYRRSLQLLGAWYF